MALLHKLEDNQRDLKEELYHICWYMRGSINIDQAWELTQEDRQIISKIIEKNVELTKSSGLALL